ncbi:MAG TPA: anti-phage dCTP deaminase [Burkholderiales bacterium]|nr:anti-phage dCTP deaminase [Burkholderiales bacterium]
MAEAQQNSSQASLSLELKPKTSLIPLPGIELFFGLVGPTGTDTNAVVAELTEQLAAVGYETQRVSLSDLIARFSKSTPDGPTEYDRIKFLMKQGTAWREQFEDGTFVARLAIAEIRAKRKASHGEENKPLPTTAYILTSFKRPEEVQLFRDIYGKAFNLISVYTSVDDRLMALSRRLAASARTPVSSVQHKALELINIDATEEGTRFGQDVRDTFPLADYFVAMRDSHHLKAQLRRLVHLVFGNPYLTPTKDEYAMFFAMAAALRSGDLSRQVGVTIVSHEGEILSSGCNEVPKAGGGLYWSDDPSPKRDLELGYEKNAKVKQELLEDLLHRLRESNWLVSKFKADNLAALVEKAIREKDAPLKDCQLLDVIEYGRTVHAEMAAITDAAKRGLSIKGARLFTTTFPCHICARHIISSGISEVSYIEPYPKSRTEELYSDSVVVNPTSPVSTLVNFFPFSGVAPRRYFDFFQVTEGRKSPKGEVLNWDGKRTQPKVKRFVPSYIALEQFVLDSFPGG